MPNLPLTETRRPKRQIRSFVRREGRITPAQRKALAELWPRYGIEDNDALLDWALLFGPEKPLTIEIGFGDGQCLRQLANANEDMAYIGIEPHRSGAGRLLMSLQEDGLTNVKVLIDDAVDILTTRIASQSVDEFLIFFPDPWPKKRHHKRRLVNADFLSSLARCLKPNGLIHITTDWEDYAKAIVDLIRAESLLHNLSEHGISPRPASRPETKYERRGVRLGHQVYDIIARRRL